MSDDREQERAKGRRDASRPVTAAARRERRASTPADATPSTRSAAKARSTKSTAGAETTRRRRDAKDGATPAKPTADDRKGRPTPTRDRQVERGSPIGKLVRFLREVVDELRKVIWPTRKQLVTYTIVVLIFVAFMVALVSVLDLGFHQVIFAVFG